MERLTEKVLTPENRVMYMPNNNSHLETMEKGVVFDYFKMWQSLGRFEDFMEENEWDSIEEMKSTLKKCEDKYFQMSRDYEELKHCIWKDTPIEQIRNNYNRGQNFDFVGVAYNRGKAKIDRKVRQENQALKDRWQKLKEWVKGQNNPIDNLVISDDETKYFYMSDILDEMQELEKE